MSSRDKTMVESLLHFETSKQSASSLPILFHALEPINPYRLATTRFNEL
jgi:hypothetical protein